MEPSVEHASAKAATLMDVARRAGVSRATASLVLRETGRVGDETRARVRQAMADLGYVYDRGAGGLRGHSTKTVGVIVTHIGNLFFAELLGGLQDTLRRAGYSCVLTTSGDDVRQQRLALDELRSHKVSAVALVPATGTGSEFAETLHRLDLPSVMMTRYADELSAPYVGPDDVLGGRMATEHLIGHGARTFAYLGGTSIIRARQDRRRGMREALEAAGFDDDVVVDIPSETSGRGGMQAVERLLEVHDLPEAIFCHSDTVAFGVYRALRVRGLASAVRVVGYDDIAMAELWEPPLTTVATQPASLGALAAQHLLDQLEGHDVDRFVQVAPTLRVRESCGCPPHLPAG